MALGQDQVLGEEGDELRFAHLARGLNEFPMLGLAKTAYVAVYGNIERGIRPHGFDLVAREKG
jgi:hypothetical protein